jgi:S-adenosylmethionine hydrolase
MKPLVLLSDFGIKEHFVACMKGVTLSVHPGLRIFDITHQIEPFNIWEAAITLNNTIPFWPAGSVFVSVVDPGVGTDRKSVVLKTRSEHYIVSPDNGTLTFIAEDPGIEELRQINEKVNRRPGSTDIHTFHGRDIYVYTGARLAAGIISLEEVGPELVKKIMKIPYQKPEKQGENSITGTITKIEEPFGNLVTNIPQQLFREIKGVDYNSLLKVEITDRKDLKFSGKMPFIKSYGFVQAQSPLLYIDSSAKVGFALNQGNFAKTFRIKAGADWTVKIYR